MAESEQDPTTDEPKLDETVAETTEDDPKTDEAVKNIVLTESDEVLESEDKKRQEVTPPRLPWYRRLVAQKRLLIPLVILLLLVILGLVPFSRYALVGLVWQQNYQVSLTDSQTKQPVSQATVTLDGKTAITDNQGRAKLKVKVGHGSLSVSKKYYQTKSLGVVVPIRDRSVVNLSLVATGRQVPLTVTNSLSGQPISNALITAAGAQAQTNSKGQVTIVLPADKSTVAAVISGTGYNDLSATIQVTSQTTAANGFHLTPAGNVYFLSNLSGTIDVVKTNLDGSDRQTVLKGTGSEDPNNTQLYTSPDWKYLALVAQRSSDTSTSSIYLINAATNQLSTMDEGSNVNFSPIGWSGDYFLYSVGHSVVQNWQSGQTTLKSFNAASGQLSLLDSTQAQGSGQYDYANQSFNQFYVFGSTLLYSKSWAASYYSTNELSGKQNSILSISANGTNRQDLKDIAVPAGTSYSYISSEQTGANNVYFQVPNSSDGSSTLYYHYNNGDLIGLSNFTAADYSQVASTSSQYILSPSGDHMLTTSVRDGQLVLQVGPSSGSNPTTVASLSTDYSFYGWYNDDYILVSQKGSQLFILPASALSGSTGPVKITDYFQGSYGYSYLGKGA